MKTSIFFALLIRTLLPVVIAGHGGNRNETMITSSLSVPLRKERQRKCIKYKTVFTVMSKNSLS